MKLISLLANTESSFVSNTCIRFDTNWYIKKRSDLEAFERFIENIDGVKEVDFLDNKSDFMVTVDEGFDLAVIEKAVLVKIKEYFSNK